MSRLVLALLVCSFAIAASAQVYKWRDAAGNMQYGDHPPSGIKAERVGRAGAAPAPSAAPEGGATEAAPAQKSAADAKLDARKRQQEADEKRKKDELAAQNAKAKEDNFRRARMQVTTLESGSRQVRVDEKGERYFLDDAQVDKEKADARRAVDEWCR